MGQKRVSGDQKQEQARQPQADSAALRQQAHARLAHVLGRNSASEPEPELKPEKPHAMTEQAEEALSAENTKELNSDDIEAMVNSRAADGERVFYPVVAVSTPEELAAATKAGAERILVKGELGEKMATAFKALRSIGVSSFNTLALVMGGAALFAPFTGGVSLGAAGTVMGTVGAALTATAIAAISAIGLALVIAVFKGYDEVKFSAAGFEMVIKKDPEKDSEAKSDAVPAAPAEAAPAATAAGGAATGVAAAPDDARVK